MKIKYGSSTFNIHPAFSPTVNFKPTSGDNEAATIEEVWDIEGSFKADGWSALMAEWDDLVEALRVPAQDFYILTDADATVYSLKAEDCLNGPTATVVNVTDKRSAYLVTNIKFSLSVKAEYINPDAPYPNQIRGKIDFSFKFDSLGFLTITERGTAKGGTITTPPDPWLSPTPAAFSLDSDFSLSKDRTECDYTYNWQERKVGLPPGIKDQVGEFSLSIAEVNTEDFLYNTVRVTGNCRLKRNKTASEPWNKGTILVQNPDNYLSASRPIAGDFIPVEGLDTIPSGSVVGQVRDWIDNNLIGSGVKILSKEITVDAYDLNVSFNFELLKESGGLAKYTYSVSISEPVVKMVEVNVYGRGPVLQRTGYSATGITESGEIVMFGVMPRHMSPHWPEFCTSNKITYPKPTVDSKQQVTLQAMSFSFAYKKEDFTIKDVADMVLARVNNYSFPATLF